MTLPKIARSLVGVLLVIIAAIILIFLNHPIILKWFEGTARHIGRPVAATVYTDGKINPGIKVFHVDKYWGSSEIANNYLLDMAELDSMGRLKYLNINLKEKWIGLPISTSKRDYDLIMGHLFQSETGGHFTPFQDDMKGLGFDPQLLVTGKEIKFNMPPNKLKLDSVRIELP